MLNEDFGFDLSLKHNIEEKDLKKLKHIIANFYFSNERTPSIEEFSIIFKKEYNYDVSIFLEKIDIPYYVLLKKLGYIKIKTAHIAKYKYYNKFILRENIEQKYKNLVKKNKILLSKDIKKNFGITLKELKDIFNMNYVEFINSLGGNHYLTISRNTKKFFEELKRK